MFVKLSTIKFSEPNRDELNTKLAGEALDDVVEGGAILGLSGGISSTLGDIGRGIKSTNVGSKAIQGIKGSAVNNAATRFAGKAALAPFKGLGAAAGLYGGYKILKGLTRGVKDKLSN